MKKQYLYSNLTPKKYMNCPPPACPTILEAEDHYLVISPKASKSDLPEEFKSRLGKNERVIKIPKDLLNKLKK